MMTTIPQIDKPLPCTACGAICEAADMVEQNGRLYCEDCDPTNDEAPTAATEPESYLARCRTCGQIEAAAFDNPEHPERAAHELSNWSRWKPPPTITRVATQSVRDTKTADWGCKCLRKRGIK